MLKSPFPVPICIESKSKGEEGPAASIMVASRERAKRVVREKEESDRRRGRREKGERERKRSRREASGREWAKAVEKKVEGEGRS